MGYKPLETTMKRKLITWMMSTLHHHQRSLFRSTNRGQWCHHHQQDRDNIRVLRISPHRNQLMLSVFYVIFVWNTSPSSHWVCQPTPVFEGTEQTVSRHNDWFKSPVTGGVTIVTSCGCRGWPTSNPLDYCIVIFYSCFCASSDILPRGIFVLILFYCVLSFDCLQPFGTYF